jgi:hypothetical protein
VAGVRRSERMLVRATDRSEVCPTCGAAFVLPAGSSARYCSPKCAYACFRFDPNRVWDRVERDANGCLVWMGYLGSWGYGQLQASGKHVYAHRYVYEMLVGPIPKGKVIDHLCRNPRCVNIDHLEVVDVQTNTLRGAGPSALNARKTHCAHGHPFDAINTYWTPKGKRACRACRRLTARRLYHRRSA